MMMKIAVSEISALTVATGRVLVGALALILYCLIRGYKFPKRLDTWFLLLVVGLLGNGIPFFLITWSEQTIDSGMAAILMSTGPIFSLVLAQIFTTDDKFSWRKLAGMVLGFSGVSVVIGVDVFSGLGQNLIPQLATIAAAFCYVFSTVFIRKIELMKPEMLVGCSLLIASALFVPISLIIDPPSEIAQATISSLSAVIYLGIVPTALAFVIRAKLVISVGYTFFSMAGYLVPIFGVIFGALFLSESIEPQEIAALLLVLCGIATSQQRQEPHE